MFRALLSKTLLLSALWGAGDAKKHTVSLGDLKWTVTNNNNVSVPGEFPSQAHLDLFRAGVIEDPLYGFNDRDQQWVQRSNWTWQTKTISGLSRGDDLQTWLMFEGLDTFAHIELCGKEVASTQNMYRQYAFDVSKILAGCKSHSPDLSINFGSATKIVLEIAKTGPSYINFTDGVNGNEYDGKAYMRKEQNDFGWDWSPSIAPAGPWRPASFIQQKRKDPVVVNNALIDVYRQGQMNNLSPDQSKDWVFNASIDYLGTLPKDAKMHLELQGSNSRTIKSTMLPISGRNNMTITGDTLIKRNTVDQWWPNGMGEQNLYDATITITSKSWCKPVKVSKRIGFRTIVLNLNPITASQKAQGIAPGTNWHFEINGKEMYAKGANLVPFDVFWPRVDMVKTKETFDLVVGANQNLLRVWASGTYLSDDIYDLADEMGILLWSEFQFTDAFYPVTSNYIDEYEAEAYYNIRRINHHPSLALWSGGNELEAIILQFYNGPGEIRDSYEKLQMQTLIKCVYANTRSISYIPSSTYHGYTDLDFDSIMPQTPRYAQTDGPDYVYADTDAYQSDPTQAFNYTDRKIGRFAAEFGSISLPSVHSWRSAVPEQDLYVDSPSVIHHNRHYGGGFGAPIDEHGSVLGIAEATGGVVEWYPRPEITGNSVANFSAWCWATQVYQADKYAAEIAFYRRGSALAERQLGSLFWQLNDLWVAPTWAAIESSGRPKAMYYATKDIYKPVITWSFYDQDTDSLSIWVISDQFKAIKGSLRLKWLDWHGKTINYHGSKNNAFKGLNLPFRVEELNGTEVHHYKEISSLFPSKKDMSNALLNVEIASDQGDTHSSWFHIGSLGKTSIPNPSLKLQGPGKMHGHLARGDQVSFTVTARDAVAANVWLDHPSSVRGYFDENNFWLNKGEKKTVKFTFWESSGNAQDWTGQVKARSLWDNTQKSAQPFLS